MGETAVTCLDGHSRCFFMLDINTFKLFVCLGDLYIIIIRQQLDLKRPVAASSDSLFKSLPSRRRLFGL